MDISLAKQAAALSAAQTRQSVETVVLKQTNEMQQREKDTIDRSVDSAPPLKEGQGSNLDKYV